MGLWKKIKQLLVNTPSNQKNSSMEEKMVGLVKMVAITEDEELSCDEVLALLDQYAEMASRGEDVSAYMPQVKHHLEVCGECEEEYEALIKMLQVKPA